MASKSKSQKGTSAKQYGPAQNHTYTVPPYPPAAAQVATTGYVFSNTYGISAETIGTGNSMYETEFFTIDFMMENNSSGYLRSQVFYSEEELVFSFIKI